MSATDESVDIAFGRFEGKIQMYWQNPRQQITFTPEAAFAFGEEIARQAYRIKYPGQQMPADFSYLANQIKTRLTDDLRNRLLHRVSTMLPSLLEKRDLSYAAAQIVDTLFAAIDTESETKL